MLQIQRCLSRLTLTLIIFQYALTFQNSFISTSSVLVEASAGDEPKVDLNTAATDGGVDGEKVEPDTTDTSEEEDWGSFYDPRDVFCGENDCYKILGLDHTTNPDTREITKSFRTLSRIWHPDKNRKKGAKEKFVKIKKAHEVLSSKSKRKEYDYYRDRPDEYFMKYGSSVMWSYAPKSDTRFILLFLFILAEFFTYFAQYKRWERIADHIIKAAVEDWSASQGGSSESMEIRQKGLEILAKQQEDMEKEKEKDSSEHSTKSSSNRQAKKSAKLNKQDKKKQDQEALKKIVEELVHEIPDFGAGFHKPTKKDLFVLKLLKFPLVVVSSVGWRAKFYFRRIRGLPYSDSEIEMMTRISVGAIAWEASSDDEKAKMLTLELWVPDNLEEWREEQRTKLLSSGDQKRLARMKKKEKKLA